jgi:hypothetical protein
MSINLGQAFAERKMTANLIGDTASRLGKSFRYLRRGQTRKAMNELGIGRSVIAPKGRNGPGQWLELQYGWKPLLSDVYGACEALSKRPKEDWTVTAKGTATSEDVWNYSVPATPTGYVWAYSCTARRVTKAFTRIDAQPQNAAKIALASVGVTNPLLIAWELVPYSFVVDWFLPIGGWLESLDALLGFGPAFTSQSVYTECNWTLQGLSGNWGASSFKRNDWAGAKRIVTLVRSASAGVPMARFPSIKDGRSGLHMANGIALLASAFGRR